MKKLTKILIVEENAENIKKVGVFLQLNHKNTACHTEPSDHTTKTWRARQTHNLI